MKFVTTALLLHYFNTDLYRNDPKFSDRQVWANTADPDQTPDQRLHCLSFCSELLDTLFYGTTTLFEF